MNQERLMNVLLSPVISEKAARAGESGNQYVFKVAMDATKPEVSKAVELLFDVKVTNVQILNQRGKMKRFGQTWGKRSNSKKAYVRLAEGQDIDFMQGE